MPTAPSGSWIDTMAGSIKEILGQAAYVETMVADPIYRSMVIGNAGLVPKGEIGRGLLFRKRFFGGGTGVIRGGNMNDYQGLYGSGATLIRADGTSDRGLSSDALASGNLLLQSIGSAVPDPMRGATLDDYGIDFSLYNIEGNIAFSIDEGELDALGTTTRDYTAPKILGLAKRLALFFATSFYANSENSNKLGTFPATVTSAMIQSNSRMVLLYPQEMSTFRFMRGQEIDIWPSTFPGSGNRLNQADGSAANTSEEKRVKCFVHDVDDTENKVTLWLASAANDGSTFTFGTNFTVGGLANAYVTPANTYGGASPGFANLHGWRHFFKWGGSTLDSNTILGAQAIRTDRFSHIDIRDHAEHKSWHKSINGALTIRRLARICQAVTRAFLRNGDDIEGFIGCPGLWLNMSEQDEAKETIETRGMPSSLSGRGVNSEEGSFVFDGKRYFKDTSQYLEDGYCLGVRRSGNFRLAVPPSMQGAMQGGILPDLDRIPIEWIVPMLTGGKLTRLPIMVPRGSGTGPANFSEMPFKSRVQLIPDVQIRGCVLDGCTTSREFSSP